MEDYKRSISYFNEALVIEPKRGDIYYNLANVYKLLNKLEEFIENFEKSIKYSPEFGLSYNNLGDCLRGVG